MVKGPSDHLTWEELACHDGTAYPAVWRESRASTLARMFEAVRTELGNAPVTILSGYRTHAYNAHVGGAPSSQHVEGRAIDIKHPELKPRDIFQKVMAMVEQGRLPELGGVGLYATWIHLDVRPKPANGHLAIWNNAGGD